MFFLFGPWSLLSYSTQTCLFLIIKYLSALPPPFSLKHNKMHSAKFPLGLQIFLKHSTYTVQYIRYEERIFFFCTQYQSLPRDDQHKYRKSKKKSLLPSLADRCPSNRQHAKHALLSTAGPGSCTEIEKRKEHNFQKRKEYCRLRCVGSF